MNLNVIFQFRKYGESEITEVKDWVFVEDDSTEEELLPQIKYHYNKFIDNPKTIAEYKGYRILENNTEGLVWRKN